MELGQEQGWLEGHRAWDAEGVPATWETRDATLGRDPLERSEEVGLEVVGTVEDVRVFEGVACADQMKDASARLGTSVVPEGVVEAWAWAWAWACRVSEGWQGPVSAYRVGGGQGSGVGVGVGIGGKAVGSDGAADDAAKVGVGFADAMVVDRVAWDPKSCEVAAAAANVAVVVASAAGQDAWAHPGRWESGQGQVQGQELAAVVDDSDPSDQEPSLRSC
jgi:hypothetical protein